MRKSYLRSATAACLLAAGLAAGCTKGRRAGPPREKVIRFSVENKISSLDPPATNDVYSAYTQALAYEALYEYHYLRRPYEIVPLLAESLPEMSKDRKTMTIRLKKGVHFQDDPCFSASAGKGREMTSADFSYSIHRLSAPKFISTIYSAFEHRIVGIDEYHAGKAPSIAGIKTPDPYTIVIELVRPLPRFVLNFTDVQTAVLARECVEFYGDRLATHAVGTGAFRITQADLGSKVVAERNPGYRHVTYPTGGNPGDREKGLLEDAGKILPFVDKVVFEIVVESQPRWLRFLAGDFEIMSAIPKDVVPTALPNNRLSPELAKLGLQHFRQAIGDVTVQAFNLEDPVWGKKRELRQAFALALDVPRIIERQYSNQAIRAQSLVDPIEYGYDPDFHSKWEHRDIRKAKELLAKAGYPEGKGLPPLVMPSAADTTSRQLDELLTRQLAEAGIALQPEFMTWPELMQRKQRHNFGVLGIGEASTVPDFSEAGALVDSRNIESTENMASYRNPAVDRLLDEIEVMDNGPERLAKIRQVKEIIDEDLPYVVMVHRFANQLAQPWVRNHVLTEAFMLGQFMKYQKVETAAP